MRLLRGSRLACIVNLTTPSVRRIFTSATPHTHHAFGRRTHIDDDDDGNDNDDDNNDDDNDDHVVY